MYHVSAQDVDERMINIHYYDYYDAFRANSSLFFAKFLSLLFNYVSFN